jgi:hypothetical protein
MNAMMNRQQRRRQAAGKEEWASFEYAVRITADRLGIPLDEARPLLEKAIREGEVKSRDLPNQN